MLRSGFQEFSDAYICFSDFNVIFLENIITRIPFSFSFWLPVIPFVGHGLKILNVFSLLIIHLHIDLFGIYMSLQLYQFILVELLSNQLDDDCINQLTRSLKYHFLY